MNDILDNPATIRSGEELPVARLETYLREHIPNASGPLTVAQFPHGHSNLTYLVRMGEREMVLRRPPFGNQVKTAHDMGREYRVLSRLSAVYAPAPRPYVYCEDESVLGAPFYVMERRRGIILRASGSPNVFDPDTARRVSTALIDNLATLHLLDYQAAGLGDLGRPDGYVARQVTGWTNRYVASRTQEVSAMERLAQRWLTEHMPRESGAALVHNDYKYDNLVLDPQDLTRIVAVLDWEMTTVGDPLMDLGTTLGYWVDPGDPPELQVGAMGPTNVAGSMTRRELAERYAEKTGHDLSNVVFYYCFGLFKIAVIIQQIYARYVRGYTHDERFAHLNERVAIMSQQAERALETGKL